MSVVQTGDDEYLADLCASDCKAAFEMRLREKPPDGFNAHDMFFQLCQLTWDDNAMHIQGPNGMEIRAANSTIRVLTDG